MKRSALALSILAGTLIPTAYASHVVSFSAGTDIQQVKTGHLRMAMPVIPLIEDQRTAVISIDISTASDSAAAVGIIQSSAPDADAALMLENYPAAPTSAEGIQAYQAVTGATLSTDAEFLTTVEAWLTENKYSGIEIAPVTRQSVLTQTADHLVLIDATVSSAEDIYLCATETFSPMLRATEQEACQVFSTGVRTDNHEYMSAPNGRFTSNKFVFTDTLSDTATFYNGSNSSQLTLRGTGSTLAVHQFLNPLFIGDVYDHTATQGDFNGYTNSASDEMTSFSLLSGYDLDPESFLFISGWTGFSDFTNVNGEKILVRNSAALPPYYDWGFEELPIRLKSGVPYGFVKNVDYLETESGGWFNRDSKRWLALGYTGGGELNVTTPVIYNLDNERFIYLSQIAVKQLEATTPEGFIPAVRAAVLDSLPAALADSYPTLPDNLSALGVDPDMTPQAFAALVNEKIVRVATSGALEEFLRGETISVSPGLIGSIASDVRWQSNELQFLSEDTLRAPYVTYSLSSDVAKPDMNISVSATELSSAARDSAGISIAASGLYSRVTASCRILSGDAAGTLSEPLPGTWGEGSTASTRLIQEQQYASATLTAAEETADDSEVMSTTLTATSGTGELTLHCQVTGENIFGESDSVSERITFNVTTPTTITGQFASVGNQLTNTMIESAVLLDADGNQYPLAINDDLSFSQPAGFPGDYRISASAEGYVFPCADFNAPLGTTDAGTLEFLRGDLNGDGAITNSDLWRFYFRSFLSGDFDVNLDGTVNNADRDMIRANRGAAQCEL